MTNFSLKIYNTRKSKNLTQKEMADLLKVRQTTISTWETGKVIPPIPMIFNIANVLDLKAIDLLELIKQDLTNEPA